MIRPTPAAGKIPVSIGRGLLAEADPFARRHKIALSQLTCRRPSPDSAPPPQGELIRDVASLKLAASAASPLHFFRTLLA
jgi:hypothetical protein